MTTYKPNLTAEEKAFFAEDVARAVDNGNALFLVSVVTTSATNLSYTYRVVMVTSDKGKLTKTNLNYWMASELGKSLNGSDNLRGNGCGFDRGFDAIYTIGHLMQKHGLTDNAFNWANDANWSWF